jgi:hypothetical protein
MGIMVAPAGRDDAAAGDAAIASIRNRTAHALFRIINLIKIHNCYYIILGLVAGPAPSPFTNLVKIDREITW